VRRSDPVLRSALLSLAFAALSALALWRVARLDALPSWLLAVSLVTFLTWGYDKGAARLDVARVPEKVLLGLSLAGGTLGAVAGMAVFRHKSAKTGFRARLVFVIIAQVAVVVLWYLWKA
jgi:uncharacterized membrane protein YsdA (DUF1294 family)